MQTQRLGPPSRIRQLESDMGQWADTTFGSCRIPDSTIEKLKDEVDELLFNPYCRMEYADCFMLIVDAYRRAGGNADDLVEACFEKLEINKTREWGEPDARGVVQHK